MPDGGEKEHELRVRRAAQRQGLSLLLSAERDPTMQDVGLYSLRDDFTTVVENQTLSYCEAWLATPVGGDVDATAKRLHDNRSSSRFT